MKDWEIKLGYTCTSSSSPLPYFEPFCGMCSVMKHFSTPGDRLCEASDINEDLILMWKTIQTGWDPPTECTEEYYYQLKEQEESSPERAFISVVASYGCVFFGRACRLKYQTKFDYVLQGYNAIQKIRPDIQDVKFLDASNYTSHNPNGYLV